jgi:pyruvate dehydrogenase E1 component alpha subunit
MHFADTYEELFYQALRIRLVEQRIIDLYPSDKIQSPVHLSIGQEAVAVGICRSLKESDLVFGSYRSHALYLAKGGDLPAMFAELYGKATGVSGGKAGSMHLSSAKAGLMGSSAVVAGTIPHAVGAALAAKVRRTDQVIVVVFGDGATDEGVYHESINFASLRQLPVILVCENNGLAVHSRTSQRQSYLIKEHAEAYGLPVLGIAEGWDFVKIDSVFSGLVSTVRTERRPRFLEIRTCRYMEHVGPREDFDAGYRTRAERDSWAAKDPLIQDRALLKKYEPIINDEIDTAVEFAEASPWPSVEALLSDVI